MPTPERRRKLFEPLLAATLLMAIAVVGVSPAVAEQGLTPEAETALLPDDDLTQAINQLNEQIAKRKSEIGDLQDQMTVYKKAIEEKRQETATVQSEVEITDNKIAETELAIRSNELELEATNLELQQIDSQIQDETVKMIRQREMIAEYLRAIAKTDQRSSIDLFLTESTLADFFNDVQFLEQSQQDLKRSLDAVETLKAGLEQQRADEASKKEHLAEIQAKLEDSKVDLSEQKSAKVALAEQLRVSETRYRYQLAQLQKEVQNINADIAATERRLRQSLDEQKLRKVSGGTAGWMWPVPSMKVTTLFHDPDYPFRYVYEHPGIDIRAPQGTPVRASRGGYVARAKDAGMGYSYVMLVHENGLSTVYGHVSKILVQEDTYIEKGEVIALSGGTPGTPGAGNMTTAPHLHFEMRQDGIPVNPLNYLQ